jgi:hypothetical protein
MADENEDAQNASGSSNAGDGGDTSGQGSQNVSGASGDQNGGSSNDASGDNTGNVSRQDFEDLKRRMQAADKNKTEAEKRAESAESELKKLREKDLSELEKTKSQLQDLQKQNASLLEKLDQQALQNAFLTHNKHSWVNPTDALRLLDREGVEVKDGNVTGLDVAIEKLAKDKPYLLADDSGKGKAGNSSSGASGSANNGRRAGEGKDDNKKASPSRFPALKR